MLYGVLWISIFRFQKIVPYSKFDNSLIIILNILFISGRSLGSWHLGWIHKFQSNHNRWWSLFRLWLVFCCVIFPCCNQYNPNWSATLALNAPCFLIEFNFQFHRRSFISLNLRGGPRISSPAFLKSVPFFGYYLPIARYGVVFAANWSNNGRLEAVVSKWLAQSHIDLTAQHSSFHFAFLREMRFCHW